MVSECLEELEGEGCIEIGGGDSDDEEDERGWESPWCDSCISDHGYVQQLRFRA